MPTRATRTRNAYAHTVRARDPPPVREGSSAFALGQNDVNGGVGFSRKLLDWCSSGTQRVSDGGRLTTGRAHIPRP